MNFSPETSEKIKRFLQTEKKESKLIPLLKEASDRQYFQLQEFPDYVLCVLLSESDQGRRSQERFVKMAKFYREHSIRVPAIFSYADDFELILMEYVGDTNLTNLKPETERAHKTHEAIALLQRLREIPANELVRERQFDRERYETELRNTARFLPAHISSRPEYEKIMSDILSQLESVASSCVTHRDFHGRNIQIHYRTGELVLLDFQDTMLGSEYYDLASFLFDPYAGRYPEESQNLFGQCGLEDSSQLLLVASQRLWKAVGNYLHFIRDRQMPGFKTSLAEALVQIQALPQWPTENPPELRLLLKDSASFARLLEQQI